MTKNMTRKAFMIFILLLWHIQAHNTCEIVSYKQLLKMIAQFQKIYTETYLMWVILTLNLIFFRTPVFTFSLNHNFHQFSDKCEITHNKCNLSQTNLAEVRFLRGSWNLLYIQPS